MSMSAVLNSVKERLQDPKIGKVEHETDIRHAYLLGLGMLAYADGEFTDPERSLYFDLVEALGVQASDAENIIKEAQNPTEESVLKVRSLLRNSRFKFYFIIDMQIMAHQDDELHPNEKEVLTRFGEMLNIEEADMTFLVDLADAVVEQDPEAQREWTRAFLAKKASDGLKPADFKPRV